MNFLSRREFAALAGGGSLMVSEIAAQQAAAHSSPLTCSAVVERIRGNVGVEWKTNTVDTFKVGDPATLVKGIVTTSMATMDVLKQSVAAGANMVITCEPTFFSKADNPNPPPGRGQAANSPPDAVLAAKRAFIQENGLVVWRFSDHWRLRTPDPLAHGLSNELGWTKYRAADDVTRFTLPWVTLPVLTLGALAADVSKKLGIRGGIRVIGDPGTQIRKIGLLAGTTPLAASLRAMPEVDVLVAGEVREWESVEYAQDTVTAGLKKGMILLGRVVSEEPGMKLCAAWLKAFVDEVPVTWIAAGDPYWRPV
jgi:putative NIF3 family GTP cyclohydrolase 1 type 2